MVLIGHLGVNITWSSATHRTGSLTSIRSNSSTRNHAIKDCAFRTPFWVDLYRGDERLVRWGQPRMLKRRRYI